MLACCPRSMTSKASECWGIVHRPCRISRWFMQRLPSPVYGSLSRSSVTGKAGEDLCRRQPPHIFRDSNKVSQFLPSTLEFSSLNFRLVDEKLAHSPVYLSAATA